jgi:luciferase family oxidoreductase group 1
MRLGILELGADDLFYSDNEYIEKTIEYCQTVEEYKYSRFWLGEHHEFGSAWRSPEIFMAILAGYTDTIKIGSAGILLPTHSTLRVAQSFRFLSSLFPNRIDLGIAKAIAPDEVLKELLNGIEFDKSKYNHEKEILKLKQFLSNTIYSVDNSSPIYMQPTDCIPPEIWVLSSNNPSESFVINNNLACSISLFLNIQNKESLNIKRDNISRIRHNYIKLNKIEPNINVAISLICDDNDSVQNRIADKYDGKSRLTNVIGNFNKVEDYINELSELLRVKEFIINIVSDSFSQKTEVAEKLSNLFKLK